MLPVDFKFNFSELGKVEWIFYVLPDLSVYFRENFFEDKMFIAY